MVDLAEAPHVIAAAGARDPELSPARMRVAAVCMLGVALATTILPFLAVDAARGPMMLELGWTADQLMLSRSLMLWATAISVWPVGVLTDRYGARPVVTVGAIGVAVVMLLLPFVRHYWEICALFSLLGVCGSVGLGYSKIVASLFDRHRGLALGIFAAEGSALSMTLPLATNSLVHEGGWRGDFAVLGVAVLAIAPLLYYGLSFASGRIEPSRRPAPAAEGLEAAQIVRSPAFWLIVLAGLVSGVVGNVVLNSIGPALAHRGFGGAADLRGVPVGTLAMLAGPVCAGLMLDRLRTPAVALAAYLGSAVTSILWCVVSPSFGGAPLLMAAFVLGAFAYSAQLPVVGYLFSRYFGLKSFATAYSLQTFIQAVVIGASAPAIDRLAHPTGDQPLVFALGTLAPLAAALLYLMLPAYRYGPPREPGLAAAPSGQSSRRFQTWWSRAPS